MKQNHPHPSEVLRHEAVPLMQTFSSWPERRRAGQAAQRLTARYAFLQDPEVKLRISETMKHRDKGKDHE